MEGRGMQAGIDYPGIHGWSRDAQSYQDDPGMSRVTGNLLHPQMIQSYQSSYDTSRIPVTLDIPGEQGTLDGGPTTHYNFELTTTKHLTIVMLFMTSSYAVCHYTVLYTFPPVLYTFSSIVYTCPSHYTRHCQLRLILPIVEQKNVCSLIST